MNSDPTMPQVIAALEKQEKHGDKCLSGRDMLILKYHHDKLWEGNVEYSRKFDERRELAAARRNAVKSQPLMPTMTSNLHRSWSLYDRHDYSRPVHKSPSAISNRDRHRSGSPHAKRQRHELLALPVHSTLLKNHRDHEQQRTEPAGYKSLTKSAPPVMETSQFYSEARAKRSPTPINDDHIVDDNFDWNSNSPGIRNSNAIDTVAPSISANSSQSDKSSEAAPFVMGVLKNIDNSCYMNSILYILRMTPTFVHGIHHLLQNIDFVNDRYDGSIGMTVSPNACLQMVATSVLLSNEDEWPDELDIDARKCEVISQLHQIFSKLTALEVREDRDPLEKKKFQAAVREIAPHLAKGSQEDSHEFLLMILNCIRECGASLMKLIQEHASMFDNIIDPASRLSFNLIEKNFIGKELTTTKCVCCETKSSRIDDLMYFYIPLPEKKEFGEYFIQESCLTKENLDKIKCEKCRHSQESIQSKSYPQLPRILIFQLGRFDNGLNKKHNIAPTPLELDCFCTPCMENRNSDECIDHKYRLYGVNVHLGVTPRSGHYTAYVRTFNDDDQQPPKNECKSSNCCQLKFQQTKTEGNPEVANGFWYDCNDESISVISEEEFQAKINREKTKNTPYILFYVRNDLLANY